MRFRASAKTLAHESNISLEPPHVSKFRHALLEGDWEIALALLPTLGIESEKEKAIVTFLIFQQKFMEFLEVGLVKNAYEVLRLELTPLRVKEERLHQLSRYLLALYL